MSAPKVVFDAMCYLQAVANPHGPAWSAFELSDSGRIQIAASEETLREAEDVLSRPNLVKKFPVLEERRDVFFGVIREVAEVWGEVPKVETLVRDPKDEPYLNLAIAGRADYLVTRDKDLLDLMADADFVARYPGLKILGPVELLRELAPPLTLEPEREQGLQP